MRERAFLKLGGSLITDKSSPYTSRPEVIRRLAEEVREALETRPDLELVIGHGSGSFGHAAAAPYGTRQGVRTPREWRGYAEVAAAAARLNRIVADIFLEVGVPVLSLQPSASARCQDGVLIHLEIRPIREALAHGLVPLIYGDVALDNVRGGTIVSTEDLFVYLAPILAPQRILLATQVAGVLDIEGRVIPTITPADLPALRPVLRGAHGMDVTGGMADKVERMAALVAAYPATMACIFSGQEKGALYRALSDPSALPGTWIRPVPDR
ncbi:MAG: isopentenyl phosphate kinase [Anaerolineae bacterium]|nr:isopentenyl phosphate kinase [Anaerolineae bacterium]MDW8067406.1 isopentenyl phosphate kinase [Anaerolineae bacterium]